MWLSVLGIYEYDNTIFDEFEAPDGIDNDDVINNILITCAELEIIYAQPETLTQAIGIWSRSNKYAWGKLYETMIAEYNPIWNVDANITENIEGTDNRTIDRSGDAGSENVHAVKGFNSNSWAESERDSYEITESEKVKDNAVRADVRTERRTGNIGVTATQDLIKKEREIAVFNIIEFITESFKERFCLMVY